MSTFTIHVTPVVKVSSPTNFHYRLVILGSRGKGQGFWNVNVPRDLLGCEPLAEVGYLFWLLFSLLLLSLHWILIGIPLGRLHRPLALLDLSLHLALGPGSLSRSNLQ